MQRLHEEDLTSYLLAASNSWHHLKIPAIADKDYFFKLLVNGQIKEYQYLSGDLLDNFKDSSNLLSKLEQEIGKF